MSDYNGGSPTGKALHGFMKKVAKTEKSLASKKEAKSKALEGKKKKKYGIGGKFGHDMDRRKDKMDYDEFIVE